LNPLQSEESSPDTTTYPILSQSIFPSRESIQTFEKSSQTAATISSTTNLGRIPYNSQFTYNGMPAGAKPERFANEHDQFPVKPPSSVFWISTSFLYTQSPNYPFPIPINYTPLNPTHLGTDSDESNSFIYGKSTPKSYCSIAFQSNLPDSLELCIFGKTMCQIITLNNISTGLYSHIIRPMYTIFMANSNLYDRTKTYLSHFNYDFEQPIMTFNKTIIKWNGIEDITPENPDGYELFQQLYSTQFTDLRSSFPGPFQFQDVDFTLQTSNDIRNPTFRLNLNNFELNDDLLSMVYGGIGSNVNSTLYVEDRQLFNSLCRTKSNFSDRASDGAGCGGEDSYSCFLADGSFSPQHKYPLWLLEAAYELAQQDDTGSCDVEEPYGFHNILKKTTSLSDVIATLTISPTSDSKPFINKDDSIEKQTISTQQSQPVTSPLEAIHFVIVVPSYPSPKPFPNNNTKPKLIINTISISIQAQNFKLDDLFLANQVQLALPDVLWTWKVVPNEFDIAITDFVIETNSSQPQDEFVISLYFPKKVSLRNLFATFNLSLNHFIQISYKNLQIPTSNLSPLTYISRSLSISTSTLDSISIQPLVVYPNHRYNDLISLQKRYIKSFQPTTSSILHLTLTSPNPFPLTSLFLKLTHTNIQYLPTRCTAKANGISSIMALQSCQFHAKLPPPSRKLCDVYGTLPPALYDSSTSGSSVNSIELDCFIPYSARVYDQYTQFEEVVSTDNTPINVTFSTVKSQDKGLNIEKDGYVHVWLFDDERIVVKHIVSFPPFSSNMFKSNSYTQQQQQTQQIQSSSNITNVARIDVSNDENTPVTPQDRIWSTNFTSAHLKKLQTGLRLPQQFSHRGNYLHQLEFYIQVKFPTGTEPTTDSTRTQRAQINFLPPLTTHQLDHNMAIEMVGEYLYTINQLRRNLQLSPFKFQKISSLENAENNTDTYSIAYITHSPISQSTLLSHHHQTLFEHAGNDRKTVLQSVPTDSITQSNSSLETLSTDNIPTDTTSTEILTPFTSNLSVIRIGIYTVDNVYQEDQVESIHITPEMVIQALKKRGYILFQKGIQVEDFSANPRLPICDLSSIFPLPSTTPPDNSSNGYLEPIIYLQHSLDSDVWLPNPLSKEQSELLCNSQCNFFCFESQPCQTSTQCGHGLYCNLNQPLQPALSRFKTNYPARGFFSKSDPLTSLPGQSDQTSIPIEIYQSTLTSKHAYTLGLCQSERYLNLKSNSTTNSTSLIETALPDSLSNPINSIIAQDGETYRKELISRPLQHTDSYVWFCQSSAGQILPCTAAQCYDQCGVCMISFLKHICVSEELGTVVKAQFCQGLKKPKLSIRWYNDCCKGESLYYGRYCNMLPSLTNATVIARAYYQLQTGNGAFETGMEMRIDCNDNSQCEQQSLFKSQIPFQPTTPQPFQESFDAPILYDNYLPSNLRTNMFPTSIPPTTPPQPLSFIFPSTPPLKSPFLNPLNSYSQVVQNISIPSDTEAYSPFTLHGTDMLLLTWEYLGGPNSFVDIFIVFSSEYQHHAKRVRAIDQRAEIQLNIMSGSLRAHILLSIVIPDDISAAGSDTDDTRTNVSIESSTEISTRSNIFNITPNCMNSGYDMCGTNGKCQSTTGRCRCTSGYFGQFCEQSACDALKCHTDGTLSCDMTGLTVPQGTDIKTITHAFQQSITSNIITVPMVFTREQIETFGFRTNSVVNLYENYHIPTDPETWPKLYNPNLFINLWSSPVLNYIPGRCVCHPTHQGWQCREPIACVDPIVEPETPTNEFIQTNNQQHIDKPPDVEKTVFNPQQTQIPGRPLACGNGVANTPSQTENCASLTCKCDPNWTGTLCDTCSLAEQCNNYLTYKDPYLTIPVPSKVIVSGPTLDRIPRRGIHDQWCQKCQCNDGFGGELCQCRVVYAPIIFSFTAQMLQQVQQYYNKPTFDPNYATADQLSRFTNFNSDFKLFQREVLQVLETTLKISRENIFFHYFSTLTDSNYFSFFSQLQTIMASIGSYLRGFTSNTFFSDPNPFQQWDKMTTFEKQSFSMATILKDRPNTLTNTTSTMLFGNGSWVPAFDIETIKPQSLLLVLGIRTNCHELGQETGNTTNGNINTPLSETHSSNPDSTTKLPQKNYKKFSAHSVTSTVESSSGTSISNSISDTSLSLDENIPLATLYNRWDVVSNWTNRYLGGEVNYTPYLDESEQQGTSTRIDQVTFTSDDIKTFLNHEIWKPVGKILGLLPIYDPNCYISATHEWYEYPQSTQSDDLTTSETSDQLKKTYCPKGEPFIPTISGTLIAKLSNCFVLLVVCNLFWVV
jgi:hypothetical protein